MLQQVCRLAEDLHALRALKRPVLGHHALVFMRVGQVRNVMTTGSTFVPSVAPYLQGRLLGLYSVLLRVLGLLQRCIWLQDNSVHCAAERVVSSLGECMHNRGWSHRVLLLLPCLRHPSTLDVKSSVLKRRGFLSQSDRRRKRRGRRDVVLEIVASPLREAQGYICVCTRPVR